MHAWRLAELRELLEAARAAFPQAFDFLQLVVAHVSTETSVVKTHSLVNGATRIMQCQHVFARHHSQERRQGAPLLERGGVAPCRRRACSGMCPTWARSTPLTNSPGASRSCGCREVRYLLRTNLTEIDPVKRWSYYLQLVQAEEVFVP